MKFFFFHWKSCLSIPNSTPVFGCNKATSRRTEVGVFAPFIRFPGHVPPGFVALPSARLRGRGTWRCPAALLPRADHQPGLDLVLHTQTVLRAEDHGCVSVCGSFGRLPRRWERGWHRRETGFLLKARSSSLAPSLRPATRSLFVRPQQTKMPSV